MLFKKSILPLFSKQYSSSGFLSKWFTIASWPLPIIIKMSFIPEFTASSTLYCIAGLSTIGSIHFGIAFVAGNILVPNPAAGITAFFIFTLNFLQFMI